MNYSAWWVCSFGQMLAVLGFGILAGSEKSDGWFLVFVASGIIFAFAAVIQDRNHFNDYWNHE